MMLYEDREGTYFAPSLTMNELKENIYNSLLGMIIPDGNGLENPGGNPKYEMAHAKGLLGLMGQEYQKLYNYLIQDKRHFDNIKDNTWSQYTHTVNGIVYTYSNDNMEKLNTDIANLSEKLDQIKSGKYILTSDDFVPIEYVAAMPIYFGDGEAQISLINVNKGYVEDPKKFGDTTQLPSYNSQIKSLSDQLNKANSALATLENNKNTTAKAAAESKSNYDNLSNKLNSKLQEINNTISQDDNKFDSSVKVAAVNSEIETLLAKLSNTEKAEQDRLATLTASNEQKTANLNKALQVQKQAQSDVEAAQKQSNDAKNELKAAKKDQENLNTEISNKEQAIQKATDELKDLTAKRDALLNAPENLAAAKTAVEKATSELKAAQAELDQAQASLKSAQDKLVNAEKELSGIKEAERLANETTKTTKHTNKSSNKTTKSKAKKTNKTVKLTHNAFVYDKNGKRVKLNWVRRGKSLKTSKIVTIKGIRYYQIGKNQFIKVANTKIKTHAVKLYGYATAKLNHKVKTVDRFGNENGHHVLGRRTYRFNEKRVINGKAYYKIAGKNDWIAASKLKLHK